MARKIIIKKRNNVEITVCSFYNSFKAEKGEGKTWSRTEFFASDANYLASVEKYKSSFESGDYDKLVAKFQQVNKRKLVENANIENLNKLKENAIEVKLDGIVNGTSTKYANQGAAMQNKTFSLDGIEYCPCLVTNANWDMFSPERKIKKLWNFTSWDSILHELKHLSEFDKYVFFKNNNDYSFFEKQ